MSPFGPVLSYDLIRMARRGRTILWLRTLYGLALLGLLCLLYIKHPLSGTSGTAPPQMLSAFAEAFFYLFMLSQFLVVVLLTPAYVGDAIAEERERRTLDYLLTTHLSNREIVLGKLMSRLANVLLFILAGLPILSLTQLLGGVSPELLWSGFAVTLLTLLSVSGLSLLQSLYAKRSRNAIMMTYLIIVGYFVVMGIGDYTTNLVARPTMPATMPAMRAPMPMAPPGAVVWPPGAKAPVLVPTPPTTLPPPPSTEEWPELALDALRAGNPIVAFHKVTDHVSAGGTYAGVLPGLLVRYAIFHGTVFLLCSGWVMMRMRKVLGSAGRGRRKHAPPVVMSRAAEEPALRPRGGQWSFGGLSLFMCIVIAVASLVPLGSYVFFFYALGLIHSGEAGRMLAIVALPPVILGCGVLAIWNRRRLRSTIGNAPMIWKEVYAEGGFRLGWISRVLILLLALGCIIPGVLVHLAWHRGWSPLAVEANQYARLVGTLLGCIALLAIGVRAASSVGVERDKQTWDGVLTTLLSNREILLGKWLGSIAGVRWLLGLLAVVWFLSFLGGGLSFLAPFLLLVCLAIYAAFMASLGLLFGVVAKSTLRAVMGTVFAGLVAGGVPWFCHYLLTEGDPTWSVPTVLALLGLSALFVSSPLLAVGMWIKRTFRSVRGLTVAVYLMCSFPLVGYFLVLGLLERGSQYTFRTWGQNVVNGITPPAVLAETAYFNDVPGAAGYYRSYYGSWEFDGYNRGLRVLCRALGLTAYLFVAALLWLVAESRFLHVCDRIEGHAKPNSPIRNSKSETNPNTKTPTPETCRTG